MPQTPSFFIPRGLSLYNRLAGQRHSLRSGAASATLPVVRSQSMPETFRCATDTATFCVFDLAAMKHRLNDDADWWSIPEAELAELNAGNCCFINVGTDGGYDISVDVGESLADRNSDSLLIQCPSGKLFVGQAEQVTSDGLEPDLKYGGRFISVAPGNYLVGVTRISQSELYIHISPTRDESGNSRADLFRV